MSENTDFIKIRTSLTKGLHPMYITSEGIKFNETFIERIYAEEEKFRTVLIVPINEEVGLHNWAITFVEHPTDNPHFFADIYADNPDDFSKIVGIIKSKIKDVEFSYYHKGDVGAYRGNH